MVYTDPRTGLQFENESIARQLGYGLPAPAVAVARPPIAIQANKSSPGGLDTRLRDANGNLVTNQIGSQFWMDAGYDEPEPSLEIKAEYSEATAAATWLTKYAGLLKEGGVDISPNIGNMSTRPTSPILLTRGTPEDAYAERYNTPAGSTAGSMVAPQSGSYVPTVASAAADPNTNTSRSTGAGFISALMAYSVYILLAVVAVAAIVVWRSRK